MAGPTLRRLLSGSGPELPVSSSPTPSSWNPFSRSVAAASNDDDRTYFDHLPAQQPLTQNIIGHKRLSALPSPACKRPPFTLKPLPPPPPSQPATPTVTLVEIHKRHGQALGVRFDAEDGEEGAAVQSVQPYGLAWREGLSWGDCIVSVRVVASGEEHLLCNGSDAAKVLRPADGLLELRVRRRRRTAEDHAAERIQAAVLGLFARDTIRERHAASTAIAAHWRRWCAIMDRRALALDRQEDRAVACLQGAWRTHIRRWERKLALEFIQQHARAFVALLRAGRRARKRRPSIRRAPELVDE